MSSRRSAVRLLIGVFAILALLWPLPGALPVQAQTGSDPGPAAGQAGTGGTATTTEAGMAQGQGLDQPPALSPQKLQALLDRQMHEPAQTYVTPADPQAPLRASAAPIVPASEVPDAELARPVTGPAAPAAPGDFKFFMNKDLGAGTGSLIPEPSQASSPLAILQTWNWYSAISPNGGKTWKYYDPGTLFPAAFGGFCCDQVVYYDQSHDLMFWILQYVTDANNNNAVRVAWAKGTYAIGNANFCWTDFTPQQLGSPTGTNYDQPKFARSDTDYYLEITRYGAAGGSVVIRIAASQFNYPNCTGVNYDWYSQPLFSPGFTQRAYGTMYFAAHVDTSHLRIFVWPESAADWHGITTHDVAHTAYPENFPHSCPRTGGSATSDWCQRRSFGGGWANSDRIFTGWVTGGVVNFMWNASQGAGGFGTFNYPYIHVVRANASTFALVNEPIMWNGSYAFQYASAALNDRFAVAGTVMYGGGSTYENCTAFIWDDLSSVPAPWELHTAAVSNADTNDRLSGDYLAARRSAVAPFTWTGSCYALQGGGANANIHPYYLWFGRVRDYLPVPGSYLPVLLH